MITYLEHWISTGIGRRRSWQTLNPMSIADANGGEVVGDGEPSRGFFERLSLGDFARQVRK